MATTIQIKRSTASAAPATTDLVEAELAYSQDKSNDGTGAILYIESVNNDNSAVIHKLGGKFYTDIVDGATNANTANKLVKRDASGNIAAGTITFGSLTDGTITATGFVDEDNMSSDSATLIPTQQSVKAYVDSKDFYVDLGIAGDSGTGAITDAETLTLTGGTGITTAVSGNAVTHTLDNTAVSAGSYGSATAIPTFTVDAQGRLTAAGTASVSTSFTIAGDSGTSNDIDGGETLTFNGTTNEIETAVSANAVTIGLPTNPTIGGNLTVSGNLIVSGTRTEVNTQTLEVVDPLFALATNNSSSDAVDIGFYGLYDTSGSQDLYSGLFRDANDGKWKLFKDTQTVPTTVVDTTGTGYAVASLVANLEGNVTGNVTGTTSSIANHDTDALSEGSSNLYYTAARFNSAFDTRLDVATIDGGTY